MIYIFQPKSFSVLNQPIIENNRKKIKFCQGIKNDQQKIVFCSLLPISLHESNVIYHSHSTQKVFVQGGNGRGDCYYPTTIKIDINEQICSLIYTDKYLLTPLRNICCE
jgi:hypothetical protein